MTVGPTQGDVHQNQVMTDFLVGFINATDTFAALKAAPPIDVTNKSDTYYKYTQAYWFARQMAKRAPSSEYARSGFGVETDTYLCTDYGLEYPVDDSVRANADMPLDLDRDAVRWLAHQALLEIEYDFASQFMAASVWGTTNTTATDWASSGATPIANVLTAIRTVHQATGYRPRHMVCGEIVFDALKVDSDVTGKVLYTQLATVETITRALAAVLGLEDIFVSSAIYNTANLGQTASYSPICDDDALVFYRDPAAGVFGASALKTFAWTGHGGRGTIETYREDKINSDVHRIKASWDIKLVAAELGYFFSDIV